MDTPVDPIALAVSLLIPLLIYFIKKRYDWQSENYRASKSLCKEMDDAYTYLTSKDEEYAREAFLPNGRTVKFVNFLLNHDSYDSLIYSGKITFLRSGLQQHVQDVFQRIKLHNSTLYRILDIDDHESCEDTIKYKTAKYYEFLEGIESELREKIVAVREKLDAEMRRNWLFRVVSLDVFLNRCCRN